MQVSPAERNNVHNRYDTIEFCLAMPTDCDCLFGTAIEHQKRSIDLLGYSPVPLGSVRRLR